MFQIFVDSAANLPAVIAKKYNIHVISFVNLIDDWLMRLYDAGSTGSRKAEKKLFFC